MKIMIIGVGGIGSFLVPLLSKAGHKLHIYDFDRIEEKNIPYQNFSLEDVGKLKVDVFAPLVEKTIPFPVLTKKQMEGFDLVVCCVDNLSARKTLYNSGVKWLDLRAQGRNAALISYEADPKQYDTLLAGPEGSFSCQGDSWDGKVKSVHFMQVVIAGYGAQWIQRWSNNEKVGLFKVVNF